MHVCGSGLKVMQTSPARNFATVQGEQVTTTVCLRSERQRSALQYSHGSLEGSAAGGGARSGDDG